VRLTFCGMQKNASGEAENSDPLSVEERQRWREEALRCGRGRGVYEKKGLGIRNIAQELGTRENRSGYYEKTSRDRGGYRETPVRGFGTTPRRRSA